MRLLLDTHIWIWSVSESNRLGRQLQRKLLVPEAELWLSPVSIWELVLLIEKGRLGTPLSAPVWVERARTKVAWVDAPLTPEVALQAASVRLPHRDPADRLLLATALTYGLTLATADEKLLALPEFHFLPNR